MKAFLIDVTAREIRAVDYEGVHDLHKLVGGYLAIAHTNSDREVLFVDDEGFLKKQTGFFWFATNDQPLAGNGVWVGAEQQTSEGEYLGTADPKVTLEMLQRAVTFASAAEIRQWGLDHARKASASFTVFEADGSATTEVFGTWGELTRDVGKDEAS